METFKPEQISEEKIEDMAIARRYVEILEDPDSSGLGEFSSDVLKRADNALAGFFDPAAKEFLAGKLQEFKNKQPDAVPGMSEMAAAEFWVRHFGDRTRVETDENGKIITLGDLFLKDAKETLPKMKDVEAKKLLEEKIKQYEQK